MAQIDINADELWMNLKGFDAIDIHVNSNGAVKATIPRSIGNT